MYTSVHLLLPATYASHIKLHGHVSCIPSFASKTDIPGNPDKPQHHKLAQAARKISNQDNS